MHFSKRASGIEIMDDLSCSGPVVEQTLRELDFINRWLGGNSITLSAVKQVVSTLAPSKKISIADLGCGSGEMLRLLAGQLRHRKVDLAGVDANPNIIACAKQASVGFPEIKFEALNILSYAFRQRTFDIITATLFLHHFSRAELVEIFSFLKKQARTAIVVNDIHRHPLAFYSILWLTRLFSKSSMVRYDAPLSVLRAFTKKDLEEVMAEAGLTEYEIRWKWAFRWQMIIKTGI